MRIRLLAFATVAQILERSEFDVEMPDGATTGDLRQRLTDDHPDLAPLWPRLAVAVDGRVIGSDVALTDGSEVALLPPVSGGQDSVSSKQDGAIERLVREPIDLDATRASVTGPECGAVVLFVGTVRNNHQGRAVEKLTYKAYSRMAEEALGRIVTELEGATPGLRINIVHRIGDLPVGEASVVIAAASPHRDAAYAASRTALERLKSEVPIWKQEHYTDGDIAWREEEPLRAFS